MRSQATCPSCHCVLLTCHLSRCLHFYARVSTESWKTKLKSHCLHKVKGLPWPCRRASPLPRLSRSGPCLDSSYLCCPIHGFHCLLHEIRELISKQVRNKNLLISKLNSKPIFFYFTLFTLQYCIDFAIHQHESATGSQSWAPLLPPSPYHPSGSSQCISPKHLYPASNLDWQLVSYMISYMFQCHKI